MANTKQTEIIRAWDTSQASLARYRFEKTGERTSPYLIHPESETYSSFRRYRRADGTEYTTRQQVSRWGGVFSTEQEKVMEA